MMADFFFFHHTLSSVVIFLYDQVPHGVTLIIIIITKNGLSSLIAVLEPLQCAVEYPMLCCLILVLTFNDRPYLCY